MSGLRVPAAAGTGGGAGVGRAGDQGGSAAAAMETSAPATVADITEQFRRTHTSGGGAAAAGAAGAGAGAATDPALLSRVAEIRDAIQAETVPPEFTALIETESAVLAADLRAVVKTERGLAKTRKQFSEGQVAHCIPKNFVPELHLHTTEAQEQLRTRMQELQQHAQGQMQLILISGQVEDLQQLQTRVTTWRDRLLVTIDDRLARACDVGFLAQQFAAEPARSAIWQSIQDAEAAVLPAAFFGAFFPAAAVWSTPPAAAVWSTSSDPPTAPPATAASTGRSVQEVADKLTNVAVHNLSRRQLSEDELAGLALGLKFIPTPPSLDQEQLRQAVEQFQRRVRLAWQFRDSRRPVPRFRVPRPSWQPSSGPEEVEEYLAGVADRVEGLSELIGGPARPNVSRRVLGALQRLSRDRSIVIKPADKNLGIAVLDREWYEGEALRQLGDRAVYEPVAMVPLQRLWGQLCRWAEQARLAGLPSQVLDFILQPRTPCLERATRAWERFRVCRFYLLPKLHKTPVAGRPICSSTLWVFEHASAVLDHYLRPLLRFSPSHLPDSLALLHQLEDLRVPAEALFLTYDVESLYPSIPIDAGISCIERWLLRWAAQGRIARGVADTLVQLLGLVMRQNHLEFGGRFWRQVRGTAMGTPVAVIYAVLFMAWLDERLLETEPELSQHVLLHRRFIDDRGGGLDGDTGAAAGVGGGVCKGELWQTTAILDTTTFQKPLNVYQYFPFSSAHPSHCKRGFILGELQRYILRESSSRGFRSIRSAFYARLRARGYPDTFLQPIFSSISYARRPELLARSRARGEGEQEAQQRVLPLVLDFHPSVQQTLLEEGQAAAGAAGAGAGAATDPALLSRVAEIRDAIQAETVPPEFTALIETESAVLAADLRAVVKTERGLAKTRKQFSEGQVAHCIPKNFVPELHLHTTEAQEQLRTRMQELQQHAQGQMQLILISGQVEDLQQLQTRVTTWRDRLLVTIDDRLARACDVGFLAQQFAAEPARSAIWQSIQTLRVRRVEQQQRQRERRQERREQAEATPVDQTMGEFVPREVERQVGAWQDEAREQLRRILERLDPAVLPAAFFGAFFPAAAVWSTPPAAAVWSTSSDPPTAPPATAASTGRSVQEVADKLTNVAVHNLSRRQLSEDELAGLALGLKFIPTPPSLDQEQLRQAVEQFQRRVRLAWQFRDSRRPVPRFRVPRPSWQPSSGPEEVEEYLAGVADRVEGLSELIGGPARPNVSRRVLGALQRLSRDRSIVIKPADKNLGIAVLDREWYEGEALRQLGDRAVYEPVAMVPLQRLWGQLCRWAEQARLAGLPSQLEDLRVPAEALFLTYDVESLYPSIPIDAGISCIERWLLRWAAQGRIARGVADTLVQLLGLVMRQNHLEFGGRFWRQVRGTAMGTPVAVIYAVLFMAWLDERLLETEPELSQHVLLHRRFIDDGVVVWTGTRERLLEWVGAFGGLEQTIRLTHEISTSQFTLLDITFSKGELWQTTAILDTTTFQKPLNVYQYFPFSSAHPSHCKRGFILGELQRYILRESSSRGFRSIRSAFYARLRARGYPDTFLQPIFSSISYARRPELLARSRARGEGEQEAQQRVLPLVLDFHPSVQQVRWGRLLAFPPEAPAFEQLSHYRAPFVSYRAPPSLRQLLVRASFR
ncbi:unnamed protein product [Closterium sp. NIES-65]|nr:unnamed protein product [Closterium sp. NIES-65]